MRLPSDMSSSGGGVHEYLLHQKDRVKWRIRIVAGWDWVSVPDAGLLLVWVARQQLEDFHRPVHPFIFLNLIRRPVWRQEHHQLGKKGITCTWRAHRLLGHLGCPYGVAGPLVGRRDDIHVDVDLIGDLLVKYDLNRSKPLCQVARYALDKRPIPSTSCRGSCSCFRDYGDWGHVSPTIAAKP